MNWSRAGCCPPAVFPVEQRLAVRPRLSCPTSRLASLFAPRPSYWPPDGCRPNSTSRAPGKSDRDHRQAWPFAEWGRDHCLVTMDSLEPGLYAELVTNRLAALLQSSTAEGQPVTALLRDADAAERLARYLGNL